MNWEAIREVLKRLITAFIQPTYAPPRMPPAPSTSPVTPPLPVTPPIMPTTPVHGLLWNTVQNIRHSVRVICDEEGLSLEQKNTLCATIQAESGFNLHAEHFNYDEHGKLLSVDRGLCQWNNYFHGKEISAVEAEENPEKAVRLMCKYWKAGLRNYWIAYKNKSYQRYL